MLEKQKKMISYERYNVKKCKEPDYLCNMIRKIQMHQCLQSENPGDQGYPSIKSSLNQKRIQQILKMHRCTKISEPEPYKKRTWVSPLLSSQQSEPMLYYTQKKQNPLPRPPQTDKEKVQSVCSVLNINKKMHLFGEWMYCDLEEKENEVRMVKSKPKPNLMEIMHKSFNKLLKNTKKSIVICNKDSVLSQKVFANPLQNQKFFSKIIRKDDMELIPLLIRSLSDNGPFTFTSYVKFYELFVWQKSSKQVQMQFVLNLLMGSSNIISYKSLGEMIDFLCMKINLQEQKEYLVGFNEVLKKLIFEAEYSVCHSADMFMSRESLSQSLLINEECISIFINVFYAE